MASEILKFNLRHAKSLQLQEGRPIFNVSFSNQYVCYMIIYDKHEGHKEHRTNKPGHTSMKETKACLSHQFHHRRMPFLLCEQRRHINTAK